MLETGFPAILPITYNHNNGLYQSYLANLALSMFSVITDRSLIYRHSSFSKLI